MEYDIIIEWNEFYRIQRITKDRGQPYMSTYTIFKGASKAYVDNDPKMNALYPLNFNRPEDFKYRIEWLDNREAWIASEKVAEVLKNYNQSLGCGSLTQDNIEALREGALAVVTGQQAGVFTGALYTVYKAITAIKLAKELSKEYNRKVIPIFWIASEDHDFQEIHLLKHFADGKVNTYSIDKKASDVIQKYVPQNMKQGQMKASIGHLKVTPEVFQTVETLLNQAAQDEIENLETLLKTTLLENDTLSNWFGRLMMKLFNEYGLVFVDPMLTELRALEVPMFERTLDANEEIVKALETQKEKVEALGFKPSLDFDSTGLNLFYYINGERLPIKKTEGMWTVQHQQETLAFSEIELIAMMRNEPNRFSTNVVLRPIVQDMLFNTVAYIGGPGEIAYYSQLAQVYSQFNLEMPIIYPRENFTVITEELSEKMGSLNVEAEAFLICGVEAVRDKVLDLKDDIRIDDTFNQYIKSISEGYDQLVAEIEKISPEIRSLTEKNKGMIINQVAYLQEKAHRFHRRNHKDLLKSLSDVEMQLVPEGGLQERTLSVLQYYGKQGESFIDYLLNELPLDHKHRIIRL